jgi:hypothetical protein
MSQYKKKDTTRFFNCQYQFSSFVVFNLDGDFNLSYVAIGLYKKLRVMDMISSILNSCHRCMARAGCGLGSRMIPYAI